MKPKRLTISWPLVAGLVVLALLAFAIVGATGVVPGKAAGSTSNASPGQNAAILGAQQLLLGPSWVPFTAYLPLVTR